MKKRNRKLFSDLEKISAHFKLKFSKIDIIKKTALALDPSKKTLLLLDGNNPSYFKTIDLQNADTCAVKVDYSSINAGDLDENTMDDFIDKIQLHLSHTDPSKSVAIGFYDTRENNRSELRQLIEKATYWRDKILSVLPARVPALG